MIFLLSLVSPNPLQRAAQIMTDMITKKLNSITHAAQAGGIRVTPPPVPLEVLPPKPIIVSTIMVKPKQKQTQKRFVYAKQNSSWSPMARFFESLSQYPPGMLEQVNGRAQVARTLERFPPISPYLQPPLPLPEPSQPLEEQPKKESGEIFVPSSEFTIKMEETPSSRLQFPGEEQRRLARVYPQMILDKTNADFNTLTKHIVLSDKKVDQEESRDVTDKIEARQSKEDLDSFLDIVQGLGDIRSLTVEINQKIIELKNKITLKSDSIGSKLSQLENLKQQTFRPE